MTSTKPAGPRRSILAAAIAAAVVVIGAGCSSDRSPRYELTVLFDEHTESTVPQGINREARVVGAAPDGTLVVEIYDGRHHVLQVRPPAGTYQPAPAELAAEPIAAMTFDPVSGDSFVLTYPQGQARIRRFHDGQVAQDFVPRTPDGGAFPKRGGLDDDEVGLFYDASSGSLLYADRSLYRLDATAAATTFIPRPKPPEDAAGTSGDDYRVSDAVNSSTGTVSVALRPQERPDCPHPDTVYRVEGNGRMTHLAGGCVKGRNDMFEYEIYSMAADPVSGDLLLEGFHHIYWLSRGRRTDLSDLPSGPVRGVAFDRAGHAYIGMAGQIIKITFRR